MADNLPQIPQTKLLLNESPLVLQRSLARAIKLGEAIVLQQLHYLINQKRQRLKDYPEEMMQYVHNGQIWVCNSYEKWQSKHFDFLSLRTLQRIFLNLEKQELLLSGNFNMTPLDKTKWYTVNYHHPLLCVNSGEINKSNHSFVGKFSYSKRANDCSKLARSSCHTGTTDNANLEGYNIKNTKKKSTTTTESKPLLDNISQEKENEHLQPSTFPVPSSNDEMKEIIRDVLAITYPYGERIKNINNLIFSMRKKLLSGELNIPEGWADFQKKKNEQINFVNQNNFTQRDAIDFEKVRKDFDGLPEDARKQYFEAAKKSAKSLASEISESTLQILAINIWAKEMLRDARK